MRSLSVALLAAAVAAAAASVVASAASVRGGAGRAGASAVTAPSVANQYSVRAVLTLPYGDIVQNIECFYDGVNQRQKLNYFDGTDIYVYRADLHKTWQVNPVVTQQRCYETDGGVSLTSLFPSNLAAFKALPGTKLVDGIECNQYVYTSQDEAKVNTYYFYSRVSDGSPVELSFLGYNIITGSHYDEYRFRYSDYQPGPVPASVFDKPDMPCQSFGSSEAGMADPKVLLQQLLTMTENSNGPKRHLTPSERDFVAFTAKYGKIYANEAEKGERERIFLQNHRSIHVTNHRMSAQGKSLRLAMNHFGDLTEKEMAVYTGAVRRARLSTPPPMQASATFTSTGIDKATLPARVDWRDKGVAGPVRDQGPCGSCWAEGTAQVISSHAYLKHGGVFRQFSTQEIVDCAWLEGNNACDGGLDYLAYQWIMSNGGLSTEQTYGPYTATDGWCRANASFVKPEVQLSGYVNITSGDETALMAALAYKGPVSVSIDASLSTFSFYSSGVYNDPNCANGIPDLDHTVLAVGYGTSNGEDYFLVKNSWSTYWGDGGYVKIARKGNICGVATQPTYPLLA